MIVFGNKNNPEIVGTVCSSLQAKSVMLPLETRYLHYSSIATPVKQPLYPQQIKTIS